MLYENFFPSGIKPEDVHVVPPRVRIHAALDEKVKFFRLLETIGRLFQKGS